jgi:DNA adenine methylase
VVCEEVLRPQSEWGFLDVEGPVTAAEALFPVVNVAQVRQLSPFRYPGGKTWLMPRLRAWLSSFSGDSFVFVEPFAGGAMAGLTVAAENRCCRVELGELDKGVSAVWSLIFGGRDIDVAVLCRRIRMFKVNLESVEAVLRSEPKDRIDAAFQTIIRNRMQRGGIMAKGAGLIKRGENDHGLTSRWYPETLARRIEFLRTLRERVAFHQTDAFDLIKAHADDQAAVFFIDPPYTAGRKSAGKRLYEHNEVNHEALFAAVASVRGRAMATYNDAPEVRALASKHGFKVDLVPMKNTHHAVMSELIILKEGG